MIYKCQYTGKEFNNALDCQESEYLHSEHPKFVRLVDDFLSAIEEEFGVQVNRETLNIYDKNQNYINDRMVHWRHLKFDCIMNGVIVHYEKHSDSVGDGRWEWNCDDTVESLVNDFERQYLFAHRKSFGGVFSEDWVGEDYGYSKVYKLGTYKLNDILPFLVDKKIEIIIKD
jgi:hypothetical protein